MPWLTLLFLSSASDDRKPTPRSAAVSRQPHPTDGLVLGLQLPWRACGAAGAGCRVLVAIAVISLIMFRI